MGLWQILKGEQPGLLKSLLHYRNAGQFGEYLIDHALQSNGSCQKISRAASHR